MARAARPARPGVSDDKAACTARWCTSRSSGGRGVAPGGAEAWAFAGPPRSGASPKRLAGATPWAGAAGSSPTGAAASGGLASVAVADWGPAVKDHHMAAPITAAAASDPPTRYFLLMAGSPRTDAIDNGGCHSACKSSRWFCAWAWSVLWAWTLNSANSRPTRPVCSNRSTARPRHPPQGRWHATRCCPPGGVDRRLASIAPSFDAQRPTALSRTAAP